MSFQYRELRRIAFIALLLILGMFPRGHAVEFSFWRCYLCNGGPACDNIPPGYTRCSSGIDAPPEACFKMGVLGETKRGCYSFKLAGCIRSVLSAAKVPDPDCYNPNAHGHLKEEIYKCYEEGGKGNRPDSVLPSPDDGTLCVCDAFEDDGGGYDKLKCNHGPVDPKDKEVVTKPGEGIQCYKCEGKRKDCNKMGTVTCPAGSYCYKQSWNEREVKRGCMVRALGDCLKKDGGCEVASDGYKFHEIQSKVNLCAKWSYDPETIYSYFPFNLCWCNTDRCNAAGKSTSNYKLIFGVLTIVACYNYIGEI